MWAVTTEGDLPDDYERREHAEALAAWSDCDGRILELEIGGFEREGEDASRYGRRWTCELLRGAERISVTIQRGPS